MEYRKCFVPSCKNDTNTHPNKIFVRVREDLREKWCREVKAEYFKVYSMFCCEDHLNPQEDFVNYYQCKLMNQEPRLKPSARLRNIAQDTREDSSELTKLLLLPSNIKSSKRKYEDITMPSTSSCSTLPTKLPNDMANYMQYHLMGLVSQVRMKPGCMPTKFECQSGRRKRKSYLKKKRNVKDMEVKNVTTKEVELGETSSGSSEKKQTREIGELLISESQNTNGKTALTKELGLQVSRSVPDTTQPSQTQTQKHAPLQEYGNDGEDTPDFKEEAEYSDDIETDDEQSNTDEDYYIPSRSRTKRARIDTTDDPYGYEEELHEFGKYVAEQLLCLDVKDAREARIKIVTLLAKFMSKRIREPSTLTPIKKTKTITTVAQAVPSKSENKLATQYIPQVKVAKQSQFITVNTVGPSDTPMNITEASVSQKGNIESSASLTACVKIEPIEDQCGLMDTYQVSSPGSPLSYIVVPATGPQFDNQIVQQGSKEGPLVSSSDLPVLSQSSSVVPARTLVTQAGSSNMIISVVTVKTEPNFESTHDSGFGEVQLSESLLVKREPRSDDET